MPNRNQVVVVGGGIAGLAAAVNLAQRGIHVVLVERTGLLGGNALTVCCKAVDGQCQLCGGCLLSDVLREATTSTHIDIRYRATVLAVQARNGGFVVVIDREGQNECFSVDAVVLATGFDHVDAHSKGPYGYGILPQVISGEELERTLTEQGQDAFDDRGLQRVAFIQCVGSRDVHVGRGYCSQVCCRYAVRIARLLKARQPKLDITIFKMDIQAAGRDMLAPWAAAQAEGIRVVAGLPAVIRRSESDAGHATFVYDDVLAGGIRREDFDLVVLSTGIRPRRDASAVARRFGLDLNADGFLLSDDDGVTTMVPGIFLAGCCAAPRSMSESVAHAQRAAQLCAAHLAMAVSA